MPENLSFEELAKPAKKDNLSDLFSVPQPDDNDMVIDHLIEAPDMEDDMSDLTTVSDEDIMGTKPVSKKAIEPELDTMPGTPVMPSQQYRIQPIGTQAIRRVNIPVRQNTTLRSQNV